MKSYSLNKWVIALIILLALASLAPGCPPTPVDTEPPPQETEPVETEPVETEPVETEPVETEPVETEPVETEPIGTEPVSTESVDTPAPQATKRWPDFKDDDQFKDAALPSSGFGPQEQPEADIDAALFGGICGMGILVMVMFLVIFAVFGRKPSEQ